MTASGKLRFFQVMAFVVGLALLVLTLHLVLRYGFGNHLLDWWAQPHGFLYMVYLLAVALLGFELRWSLPLMVGVMLAGTVPFLSFYVEQRMTRRARRQLAGREPVAGTLSG